MSECRLCDAGSEVIDGWHYTRVGGMVFPTNRRCEKLHPRQPRPTHLHVVDVPNCQCGVCGGPVNYVPASTAGQIPKPDVDKWPARCEHCDLTVMIPITWHKLEVL